MSAVCELEGVIKRYGPVEALAGVTARIEGQVIGLLGPNGAGKSTLLKCMLGLAPYSGNIRVLGMSPDTDSFRIRDRVGYMPEKDAYLARMTAVELCVYAAELSGLPRTEAMQRAHAALYYAGLEDKRYLKVEGYSTGQKQRVKLAAALVHDPELLFLDEPTNGLDPRARDDMLRLVADLPAKRGCSVILSTHILPDVDRVCDQVLILERGRMRFSGTIDQLRGGRDQRVFDIEVKDKLMTLTARLQAAGCVVEPYPPRWTVVVVPEGKTSALILREARAVGAQIRHLEVRRESLETAFLRVLGTPVQTAPPAMPMAPGPMPMPPGPHPMPPGGGQP
ncbi:MAG TPA: ABC transporter ATP-binding protein [Kofleriaceae bacterium]|nr:ABC transporter ATP-binding protein [Kofleriaceae bacterium]